MFVLFFLSNVLRKWVVEKWKKKNIITAVKHHPPSCICDMDNIYFFLAQSDFSALTTNNVNININCVFFSVAITPQIPHIYLFKIKALSSVSHACYSAQDSHKNIINLAWLLFCDTSAFFRLNSSSITFCVKIWQPESLTLKHMI